MASLLPPGESLQQDGQKASLELHRVLTLMVGKPLTSYWAYLPLEIERSV